MVGGANSFKVQLVVNTMPNSFDDAIKSLFKISHDTPLTLTRSFQTTHSNPAKKKLNRDESFLEKTDSKVP